MRLAYADRRTPWAAKLLIGLTVGYLLSPIDLIPDFIPVLGLLDDLLIVPLLISLSIKLIPPQVMAEARQKHQRQAALAKKENWLVAALIVLIWLALLFWLAQVLGFLS